MLLIMLSNILKQNMLFLKQREFIQIAYLFLEFMHSNIIVKL